jgi:hypothetical protein
MKTKASKLTTTEKRAVALCESIRQTVTDGGSYPVTVEWVDSRTWGSNPRILHHGEKVTNVSGCGYCKHSTALAEALRWLGSTEEEKHSIGRKGGAGVRAVVDALAECGWKLECVSSGKSWDAYHVSKIQ